MKYQLGRSICAGDSASGREWLATNGIGGFASGTISGELTRRYHGLLFASLDPPLGRTLLLAKADATVEYEGREYPLDANRWADGSLDPRGFHLIDRFALEGTIPTWSYSFADVRLERSIWMEQGANATCIRYRVLDATAPLTVRLKLLVNARDYHALTHAYETSPEIAIDGRRARVKLNAAARDVTVRADRGEFGRGDGWYYGFRLRAESERGLDDLEDHYHALTLSATLEAGEALHCSASADVEVEPSPESYRRRSGRDATIVSRRRESTAQAADAPRWVEQLVLAADQFIADRDAGGRPGKTIVAGYPWFGDWGRDTMIALPGLTLETGRHDVARDVLSTFARFVDRGMLPNRFPDAGEAPEYNTVDATLWFVEAVRRYVEVTRDFTLLAETFAVFEDIVAWHLRGTRYGIRVDERDGLLFAGEDGVQLTWMDAKVGDHVITPRTGKAVEINALWYNALVAMEEFAERLGKPSAPYADLAERARTSFERFWNASAGYCFDVIDGPSGDDRAIRPNAVIAASLANTPLDASRCASVVRVAAKELVTPYGLRSLSPNDPQYVGRYTGSPAARDAAYHQGTIWPWLLGPFVGAHLRAFGDAAAAARYLDGIDDLVTAYGVGSIAEIAEGDAPYRPCGCTAQAWSVGEILRAQQLIDVAKHRVLEGASV